ncbi:VIT and vWA domain-containing protein [Alteromonas flava]|uniref:VIT and vWA domain-containing protein n=1 Tax=Alteromonas flava TaxID=2048003 RepID=UPI000C29136B|nr:VIT domain-containing protein [Alteromonas flava]
MFRIKSTLVMIMTLLLTPFSMAAGLLTPVGQTQALSIQQHQVKVTVDHSFAVIEVEQVFSNPHTLPLEAIYSFPVPNNASVGEFTYWLNGIPVHAEVLAKETARSVYAEQKAQGRNAALVEKNDYLDFQIKVSQIPAGQDVRLKLVYLQPVHVDHGIARFVYPLQFGGTDEAQNAFWTANEVVEQNFSFDLTLNSSYPVADFRLPAHPQAHISSQHEQNWKVNLTNKDPQTEGVNQYRLDQDIVVYWRLASDLPGSIDMMTYRATNSERGTFLMTLTPGNDLAPLSQGRDWIIVLDYSGSMAGKYQTLLQGVQAGLKKLSPNDRIKIVLFNDSATLVREHFTPATPTDINHLIQSLDQYHPDGGTNLYAGLESALDELDADRTSAIWLVTDGVANVGETKQQAFIKLMQQKDVRLFTFIMGNSANQPLLNGLTKASNGFALNVSNSDDITGLLLNAASKVKHQSLRDIAVNFTGVKVADVHPVDIKSLYRGQQLVLTGHYWGDGELQVELTAKRGSETVSYNTRFPIPTYNESYPELERLWAFNQIETLIEQQQDFGEDADRQDAIVDLAIEYGLVTDYTSMLVVEEDVFAALGIDRANQRRIEKEQRAREQRQLNPINTTKVDQQAPMFNQPRATYSNSSGSGGSMGKCLLVLLLVLVGYRKYTHLKLRLQHMS